MTDRVPFLRRAILLLAGALALAGCADRDVVKVKLQTRAPTNREVLQLQVDALVSGPLANLRYKWFAVSGTCSPQESAEPGSLFRFAEGVPNDRITVEVWREDRLVARSETDVHFSSELAKRFDAAPAEPGLIAAQLFVKPGRRADGHVEIVSGLKAGDQVVTAGQNRLFNGSPVVIDNSVDPSVAEAAQ